MKSLAKEVVSEKITLEDAMNDIEEWDWNFVTNTDSSIKAMLASRERKHFFHTTLPSSSNINQMILVSQVRIEAAKELQRLVGELQAEREKNQTTPDIIRGMTKEGDVIMRYNNKKEFVGISLLNKSISAAYVFNSEILDLLVEDGEKCFVGDDGFVSCDDGSFFFTINKVGEPIKWMR